MSESITDWYSDKDSSEFKKTKLVLTGDVFLDATEFGDVLVTGAATELALPVVQGIEVPSEGSSRADDRCGQGTSLSLIKIVAVTREIHRSN